MAEISFIYPVAEMHGKVTKNDKGYFYKTQDNKNHYRVREEVYQQKQSPRQQWNSAAFKYAHEQLRGCSPYRKKERFNACLKEWKEAHPFEEWCV